MAQISRTVEVDGQEYETETVSRAMLDAIIGRAPVEVMDDQALRDGISARIRWALGSVSLIASHDDTDDAIIDTADSAAVHLQQARDMFRALIARPRTVVDD